MTDYDRPVFLVYWLVEYVGSKPCPVYASWGTSPTCDAWHAAKFRTKRDAELWMTRPGVIPFTEPWAAIEHEFTY